MARLATMKGDKQDELRRLKDKSRKTQQFLTETKKVPSNKQDSTQGENTQKSMKATMMSGGGSSTGSSA